MRGGEGGVKDGRAGGIQRGSTILWLHEKGENGAVGNCDNVYSSGERKEYLTEGSGEPKKKGATTKREKRAMGPEGWQGVYRAGGS